MASKLMTNPLFSLLLILFSCNPPHSTMQEQKYDWNATVCAPKAFPIELLSVHIKLSDSGGVQLMPKALIANGWGELGSTELGGDDTKAMPIEMEVKWFSYVERKGYKGTFKLDPTRFQSLFKSGLITPADDEKKSFDYIVIGLAPLGAVSIWLAGSGVEAEVAQFKATEMEVGGKEFLGSYTSIETYATDIVKKSLPSRNVQMSNVPMAEMTKWTGIYRQNYNWYWNIIATVKTNNLLADYFNGESIYWPQMPDSTTILNTPLPKQAAVDWTDSEAKKHATEFNFDETELFAAFNKLGEDNEPIGIQLEINSVDGGGQAFATTKKHVIALKKTTTKEPY
ncbi:MAG: DUF2931 family protein [Chitinophagaceae bacterium]